MISNIFFELSVIILIALIVCSIVKLLKQPLILGYIITGIIVSPYFLNIIKSADSIAVFSQIGVALLLFMVGLNLNPKIIKEVGKISLITGLSQVVFTSIIGFFIMKLFGFSDMISLYVSIALSFSSTIIVMKLLSDKGDIDSLYGKISIGILIVQDIIAILVLMIIPSFNSGNGLSFLVLWLAIKAIALLILLLIFNKYFMPFITKLIASSQEFLFLFSIGWALTLSALFYYLDFSMEIGALLAGVSLSMSSYRFEISSKMKPLRDFFIIMFFVLLGSQMVFMDISKYLIPIIIFSLFVLIGNALVVMITMGLLGYTKRTGFLTGIAISQISEFSFIMIALGVKLGHLTNDILSFVTIIGLITIAGSSYFVYYSDYIYMYISKYLNIFEKKGKKIDESRYHKNIKYDIILFGYNRIGYSLVESFKRLKKKFLIIDYNPEIIKSLVKQKIDCRYGDAGDSELLADLKIEQTKMIVSTIPDLDTNLLLIHTVKKYNKNAIIIVVSHRIDDSMNLYKAGASYVIMPHFLGGYHTSLMIEDYGLNLKNFLKEKIIHIKHLKNRKNTGQEHPLRHEN